MPLPAEIRPSQLAGDVRIVSSHAFRSFSELTSENPQLYNSVARLFMDTYNAPPWNEEWNDEMAGDYFGKLMQLPSQVTTVQEGSKVIGLFIGCTGSTREVVPLSVEAYFPEEPKEIVNEIKRRIFVKIEEVGGDQKPAFWGCDFAVPPEKRGAVIAGKLLREAIKYPIEKGITDMYGMTMIGSPFHTITERRGSRMLLEVKDVLPKNPRVFKIMDMRGLLQ